MEVRLLVEGKSLEDDGWPWDFYDFQNYISDIPKDYCHKYGDEQYVFHCLVCPCSLTSLEPLRVHVMGRKHVRKALEKKRRVLGLEREPANQPRAKVARQEAAPSVDIG